MEAVKRYLEKGGDENKSAVDGLPLRSFEGLVMQGLQVDLIEPGRLVCTLKVPTRLLVILAIRSLSQLPFSPNHHCKTGFVKFRTFCFFFFFFVYQSVPLIINGVYLVFDFLFSRTLVISCTVGPLQRWWIWWVQL